MAELSEFLKGMKKEEGVGSGNGFIGQIKVEFGYKLYLQGMSNEESWIPYKAGDENAKKIAHASALNALKENGLSDEDAAKKLRQSSVAIIVQNGSVLNRSTNWKGDQYFVYAIWTDGYQQVVEPSLSGKIKSTSDLGKWLWGWVKFMPDPKGRTRTYTTKESDGTEKSEERTAMVAYIEEIFPTKVAAVNKAAELGGGGDEEESGENNGSQPKLEVPDGFTESEWNLAAGDIKKASAAGKSPFALSKDYGVEIRFIKAVLGQ